jgi:hypothetical protein
MTRLPTDEFAAFVGIAWAEATHDIRLPAAGAEQRECRGLAHPPDPLDAWASPWRQRCHGHPMARCLALHQGPLVSALRTDDFLGLFPVPPLSLARDRAAFTPSQAKDDPTDAARQRPALHARAPLVAPRRRVVGDTGRFTTRTPYNAAVSLSALKQRGAPLLHNLAKWS